MDFEICGNPQLRNSLKFISHHSPTSSSFHHSLWRRSGNFEDILLCSSVSFVNFEHEIADWVLSVYYKYAGSLDDIWSSL